MKLEKAGEASTAATVSPSKLEKALNESGDRHGATMDDDGVIEAPGYKDAYQQYIAGGWTTMPCDPEFGGMGMPHVASSAVSEMWASSNLAFSIGPMLSIGAISALEKHADDTLKNKFLAKMISGDLPYKLYGVFRHMFCMAKHLYISKS